MTESQETPQGAPQEEPVTDTGSFGEAADTAYAAEGDQSEAEASEPSVDDRIAELTSDLQRLQAEYVNYKRRVERDRELVAQNATYKVLAPIVEVLDTIDRAREHGELGDHNPGLKAVADQLSRTVEALGLSRFGEPGEAFDPTLHEALSHLGTEEGIETTTVKVLAKAGYRIGDRVVRAAQVLVVDPE
ncbi:MAG: nucleotide exchange factor GrpE [Nocardioides sp.]|uniref:nucleotide exchange factor GrpE n=1 Tax=Nocardioides sp. TaxID=35761 RepID=UPI0039E453B8